MFSMTIGYNMSHLDHFYKEFKDKPFCVQRDVYLDCYKVIKVDPPKKEERVS